MQVRGVGTGGIVSSAFCLLFKLFTLRLTRKQVNGLINHRDSPYIRGIGFLYIRYFNLVVYCKVLICFLILCRYTQPPADLWDWFEAYLDDEEVRRIRRALQQVWRLACVFVACACLFFLLCLFLVAAHIATVVL